MAKELDLQRWVVNTVRRNSGFAFKLSNRFLVGVPDILIQMPFSITSIWEVKVNDRLVTRDYITLEVTAMQEKWLRDYATSMGVCGVISFVRDSKELMMAVYPIRSLAYPIRENQISLDKHRVLTKGKREEIMMELLKEHI